MHLTSHMHRLLILHQRQAQQSQCTRFNLFVTCSNGNKLHSTFSLPATQRHEALSEQEPQEVLQHDSNHMTDTNDKHDQSQLITWLMTKETNMSMRSPHGAPQRVSQNQSAEHMRAQRVGPTWSEAENRHGHNVQIEDGWSWSGWSWRTELSQIEALAADRQERQTDRQERQAEQRAVRVSQRHKTGCRLPGGTFWVKRRNATPAGTGGLMRGWGQNSLVARWLGGKVKSWRRGVKPGE